jgi:cytochrome c2
MAWAKLPDALRMTVVLLLAGVLAAVASLWVQKLQSERRLKTFATELTHGDAEAGEVAFRRYGCGACHTITLNPGADGRVGPSLDKVAGRPFLAGRLTNTPDQMIAWLQHPQALEPGSGMPDVGVTDRDARDLAAYLYTLK